MPPRSTAKAAVTPASASTSRTAPHGRPSLHETRTLPGLEAEPEFEDEDNISSPSDTNDAATTAGAGAFESQTSTQGKSADSIETLMQSTLAAQQTRHHVGINNLQRTYDTAVAESKKDIETVFTEYEGLASNIHATHLQRLNLLIARKHELEDKMQELGEELQTLYQARAADVKKAVDERVQQLKA